MLWLFRVVAHSSRQKCCRLLFLRQNRLRRQLTQVDVMFTGVLTIGITGNLLDGAIRLLERYLLRWNPDLAEGR